MKIPRFSDLLAERFYSENHLSDYLYVLFRYSKLLHDSFIDLISSKSNTINELHRFKNALINIEREYQYLNDEFNRADLLLEYRGLDNKILIEVKKYDKNLHYEYYLKVSHRYPIVLLCIIPPPIHKYEKMIIITWQELLDNFEKTLQQINDDTLHFLKEILNYMRLVTMSIKIPKIEIKADNIWLYHLNLLLRKIIQKEFIPIEKGSFTREGSGYFFNYPKDSLKWKLWFGLNYNEEHRNCFMGWIDSNNARELFERIKMGNESSPSRILGSNDYCFKLNKDTFDKFFKDTTTKEQQEKILTDFLYTDFIPFVEKYEQ